MQAMILAAGFGTRLLPYTRLRPKPLFPLLNEPLLLLTIRRLQNSGFDHIIHKYGIEKIKTVGDAYICAGGLPVLTYSHAEDTINAAMEIRDFMLARKVEKENMGENPFELRIGIHTGPVVAGIVGVKKFAYDIWGDTVNIAARMESSGEAGKVNISGTTYELVKDIFNCSYRGKVQAKKKGEIDMYFVESKIIS